MIKKFLSILISFLMIFSLSSCKKYEKIDMTNLIASYNTSVVTPGIYKYLLFTSYNYIYPYIENPKASKDAWLVNGVKALDLIEEDALSSVKSYLLVEDLFKKYKLKFDQKDYEENFKGYESFWEKYSEELLNLGINKDDYISCTTNGLKSKILINSLYGKKGEFEINDEDLKQYINDNYKRVIQFSINLDGIEEENAKLIKDLFNVYKLRIENGENIQDLVYEEYARQNNVEVKYVLAYLGEHFGDSYLSKDDINDFSPEFIDLIFNEAEENKPYIYEFSSYLVLYELQDIFDEESYSKIKDEIFEKLSSDKFLNYVSNCIKDMNINYNEELLNSSKNIDLFD